MSVYIRRYNFDPGDEVLLEIESVNILDLEPPSPIRGIGTGTVLMVGEFEDGPFNKIKEITSGTDLTNNFGSLGYTYGGVPANYPCAVSRRADGALVPEYWNGNGFVQLSGKQFARLLLVRADTSVGTVTLYQLASLTGGTGFTYSLNSGEVLALNLGAGQVSATFTGGAATVTSSGQTFPTLFAGGETVTLGYDGAPDFVVTFLDADETQAAVIARINQYAGFSYAASVDGTHMSLTGIQKGTGGKVRVVAASAGSVLTKLGLVVGTTVGAGNVANIGAITPTEINTVVAAAIAGTKVEQDSSGRLRVSNTATPLTGTLAVGALTTATGLGFTVGQSASAATLPTSGSLPAGTLVQTAGGTKFVTMQTVKFTQGGAFIAGQVVSTPGTYSLKVRHAVDDGTGALVGPGLIVQIPSPPDVGAFSAVNLLGTTAALTEPQIDVQYQTALDATLDVSTIAKRVNISFGARQSNRVRRSLRQNAIDASSKGCFGRVTCIRPPLNTERDTALSTTAEPGVGAYRDRRVIYNYIGFNTYVPLIARRGTAGGAGFTPDGNVDVGSDGFCASIMSQLPPEENPGQETGFTGAVNSIETGDNVQGLTMDEYTLFKAAGICAARMDDAVAIFQSGCTAVDPDVNPGLVNIARQRMADFITDSLAQRAKTVGKKTQSKNRRHALMGDQTEFMDGLLSPDKASAQRIESYDLTDKDNTKQQLGQGLYRITLNCRTLSSFQAIVIESTIGENVITVQQQG